jgi:hypothetical protein
MNEEEMVAAMGENAVLVHDTLKTGSYALQEAAHMLDDSVLAEACEWAAVAMAYSHSTFCRRIQELYIERTSQNN